MRESTLDVRIWRDPRAERVTETQAFWAFLAVIIISYLKQNKKKISKTHKTVFSRHLEVDKNRLLVWEKKAILMIRHIFYSTNRSLCYYENATRS